MSRISPEAIGNVVFAYEPFWSIGEQGRPAEPACADEQHRYIKSVCTRLMGGAPPVLHGGSIDFANAREYLRRKNVDGLFIGRYALDPTHFIDVVSSCVSSERDHP